MASSDLNPSALIAESISALVRDGIIQTEHDLIRRFASRLAPALSQLESPYLERDLIGMPALPTLPALPDVSPATLPVADPGVLSSGGVLRLGGESYLTMASSYTQEAPVGSVTHLNADGSLDIELNTSRNSFLDTDRNSLSWERIEAASVASQEEPDWLSERDVAHIKSIVREVIREELRAFFAEMLKENVKGSANLVTTR